MTAQQVLDQIQEHEVEFVDFRFADMLGKHHHVTFPAHSIDESTFEALYELEIACERYPAKVSLEPLYDPKMARIKA